MFYFAQNLLCGILIDIELNDKAQLTLKYIVHYM